MRTYSGANFYIPLQSKFKDNVLVCAFNELGGFSKVSVLQSYEFSNTSLSKADLKHITYYNNFVFTGTLVQEAYFNVAYSRIYYPFTENKAIRSIIIGDNIENMGQGVCSSYLSNLELIVISAYTKYITAYYFRGTSANIIFKGTRPLTTNNGGTIDFNLYGGQIFVPNESVDTYKAAWNSVSSRIHPISDYGGEIPRTDIEGAWLK